MLKLVQTQENGLLDFCGRDPFGTKIAGYYETFGTQFPFALFWLQFSGERLTAAVCRVYSDLILCAREDADFCELSIFVRAIGFLRISCEESVCASLGLEPVRGSYIAEYSGDAAAPSERAVLTDFPSLPRIHSLLSAAGFDNLGDRDEWMADISARMRKGVAKWCIIEQGDDILACAAALFISRQAAFLGCVAADRGHRNKGLGSSAVLTLARSYAAGGKRVELFCADDKVAEFYKKIGFRIVGRWAEAEYIGK